MQCELIKTNGGFTSIGLSLYTRNCGYNYLQDHSAIGQHSLLLPMVQYDVIWINPDIFPTISMAVNSPMPAVSQPLLSCAD